MTWRYTNACLAPLPCPSRRAVDCELEVFGDLVNRSSQASEQRSIEVYILLTSLIRWLVDPSGLTPHGFCLLWEPGLIWTYASTDLAIGAAYFMIPVVLVVFIHRRQDVAFQPLFWLFAAFILLCGVTHWLDLLTLWVPAYGVQAVAKAATAIVSMATVVALWRLLPQALALPSSAQLQTANDALRKAEGFLARVSRVAGIGGWEHDLRSGTVYWSNEVRRLRGLPPGYEPTLQAATDFYAPEAQPVIRAAMDRAIADGEGWDLELQVIRADGHRIWIRNVGSAEFMDGQATRLIGASQDVTERVMQRAALEEATERLALATDGGGVGLWEWDVASGRLMWNPVMYRLYGMESRAEAISYQSWLGRVHPDDREIAERALQNGFDGSEPFDSQYRVSWDDGTLHYIRTRGRASRGPTPDVTRVVGASWDITASIELAAQLARQAELQVEAAEREAAELETAIFRNSPDTLFVVRVEDAADGPDFVYESLSPAYERLTGRRPEDMVGQRPAQCLPPKSADMALRRYRRCVAERTSIAYEETHILPNGTKEIEGTIAPVQHLTTGRITRIVGTVRDVTERNRIEAALRQAQKLEAIGRLSAGVAHDFNNILQSIVGGLEMILEEVSQQTPAHNFAEIALKSAMRGAYLTHHLLSYARKQLLRPSAVELAPLLAEMQVLLSRTLGPHIDLQVDADRTLSVLADPGQLQTALLNLAINASHAMPEGGTLRMDTREESGESQTWIVLTVADTGTGMDSATLAQAVEPFFSTKGLDGSGLGLSMVQGFVEQSGGSLSIMSAPGQGTTVEMRLTAAAANRSAEASATAKARQASGRILLVDDVSDVLVTTSAFLEHSGFVVTRAHNGQEALTLLAASKAFDVLVSDYAMPGLNGADLIAEARLVQPALRVLLITGYSDIAQVETLAEPVPILHKPFKRAELVAAVHDLMKQV
jgi:PAS domain S-box-containing protein